MKLYIVVYILEPLILGSIDEGAIRRFESG